MPTDQILVTFAALGQAHADTSATANELNQQLADLKTYLSPLVSTWTGGAATDYNTRQAEWDRAQQGLNEILSRVGMALGQSHENYVNVEQTNSTMWTS